MNSSQFIRESLEMIEQKNILKDYFDENIAHQSWDTLIPNFEQAIKEESLSIAEVVRLSLLLGVFAEVKRRGV